tara:strand:+ start:2457 stop:2954 length:498 start_codon:yes stop_codon:yes gene_type:complete
MTKEGCIINPATGRAVKTTTKLGKKLMAQAQQLDDEYNAAAKLKAVAKRAVTKKPEPPKPKAQPPKPRPAIYEVRIDKVMSNLNWQDGKPQYFKEDVITFNTYEDAKKEFDADVYADGRRESDIGKNYRSQLIKQQKKLGRVLMETRLGVFKRHPTAYYARMKYY